MIDVLEWLRMKLDSCPSWSWISLCVFLVLLKKCYGVTVSWNKIMQALHGLCSFRLAIQVLKVYLGSPTKNRVYNRGGGWATPNMNNVNKSQSLIIFQLSLMRFLVASSPGGLREYVDTVQCTGSGTLPNNPVAQLRWGRNMKIVASSWQPRKPEKIGFRGLKSTNQNLQTHMPICIHENKLIYLCNCESRLHIHSESRFSKFHLDFMLQGMLQWQHLQADLWCRGSELWWSLTSSEFLLSKVREEHVTRHTNKNSTQYGCFQK